MKPCNDHTTTLVDLLDRVLDKGLVIHADLIVSVAGIPLIGVNLRAALAGMETLLHYGIMAEDDRNIREQARGQQKKQMETLFSRDTPVCDAYGACWCPDGLYKTWRYGRIFLTPRRLVLFQAPFDTILFEVYLREIRSVMISENDPSRLFLRTATRAVSALRSPDRTRLVQALDGMAEQQGRPLEIRTIDEEFSEELTWIRQSA